MDCHDARRLIAAAKNPLASIRPVLVDQWYLADTRAEVRACGLDLTPLGDPMRCRARVGNGRCRKRVSGVAITQYCCKHQQGRSITEPGDRTVEWALLGEPPRAGDEYVGERDAQHRYHGKGVLRRANLPGHCVGKYEGSFFRGRYHGMGRRASVISYIGQCFLGTAHGKGRLTYSFMQDSLGVCYTGEFAADLPHGQGVWKAASGARHEGQSASPPYRLGGVLTEHTANQRETEEYLHYMIFLYKNSICGLGVRTQSDGKIWAGEWRRGEFHGYGVHALPDGTDEGRWAKGQLHGFGRRMRQGSYHQGQWVRGQQAIV